jgi:hypothetical protein
VIDDSLHQVETPPSQEELPGQPALSGQAHSAPGMPEQQVHPSHSEKPDSGMEETVPPHVLPDSLERHRWNEGRPHVVPVQNLVEQYSIDKTAQSHAKKPSGNPAAPALVHRPLSFK